MMPHDANKLGTLVKGIVVEEFFFRRTFHRQLHRTWALKFMAALTTRLGKDDILPYLSQILQPLYRIQESGSAPNTDEVG